MEMMMANDLQIIDPAAEFRKISAGLFHKAADMTLHELVDEYARLTDIVAAHTTREAEPGSIYSSTKTDAVGKIAIRQRQVFNGALRAPFGLALDEYDRGPHDDTAETDSDIPL